MLSPTLAVIVIATVSPQPSLGSEATPGPESGIGYGGSILFGGMLVTLRRARRVPLL